MSGYPNVVSALDRTVTATSVATVITINSEEMNTSSRLVERVPEIEKDLIIWTIIDGTLLFIILFGNILTILAVRYSRRLRSVISNHFVLSLAISDILVGLTLPYHLAFYMGTGLGSNKGYCLLRFFFVILACCVSIWNLIAIAVDRYIAICYPLHYGRYMTRKVALVLMGSGWLMGFFIASIPIIWNNWESAHECEFDQIFHPWYMAGVITPIFSLVWFTLIFVYWRIWREASKHCKQLRITGLQEGPSDWKSVQVVLLILGGFSICWLPYFVVACAQIFKFLENGSPIIYKAAFSLAMSNSAMNPLIYAWKNSNFRKAFSRLLVCKSPDTMEPSQSMRSNLHRKSSSVQHQDVITGDFPNYSTPPFMQRKGLSSAATINDPISGMGVTFEEDEDKLSTNDVIVNPQSQQQITIHIENDALQPSKHRQYSSNSIPDMHFIEARNCTSKPVTPTSTNGHGNLIINKCAIYENYVNDDDELGPSESETNKYLNINNLAINKKSKFKSKSANSIATTHTNINNNNSNHHNNNNHECNNNNPNPINGTITSGSSKQSIEYVINERANSRKFLPNFSFSGNKSSNSCSGVIGLGLTNTIDHCPFNDPKIVCKIVDRN